MKRLLVIFISASLLLLCNNVSAQKINNVFKVAKEKTVNKTNTSIDQTIDGGLNKAESTVKGVFKPKEKTQEQQEQTQQTEQTEQNQQTDTQQAQQDQPAEEQPTATQAAPSLEVYSKYDFIPGEKVIFYEDFSQDAVGDFPALWNTNGSAEVVTTSLFPGKWMKFDTDNAVWTDELLKLPDNFTIEFDVIPIKSESGNAMSGYYFVMWQVKNVKSYDYGSVPGNAGFFLHVEYFGRPNYRSYINWPGGEDLGMSGSKDGDQFKQRVDNKYHIAIWVQKSRVRLYQDQNKLFDLPKAFNHPDVKIDRIRFEGGAGMVTNIRIAVGAPDTRNKLLTEGKLVTYGIYFDVNKDVVKPESYGTLKDIATVLNENPAVKVKILGFTDSDGDDASNLDLSKRRAAAVKAELAKNFAVDGSRLETDGLGEQQPVAPNDNQANKALNRRVEFIKL